MTALTFAWTSRALCRAALAVLASAAIALPTPAVAADRTELEGPQATIDVNVALGDSDDAVIAERITGRASEALREQDITILEGTARTRVHVTVRRNGEDDHEITLKVTNKGEATQLVEGSPFVCAACSENELLAKISEVLPNAAPLIAVPNEADPDPGPSNPGTGDDPVVSDPGTTGDGPRRPLGGVGKAGIGLMVVGVGGVVAGGVLVGIGSKRAEESGDPADTRTTDFRPPGIAVLAVGGAVLLAGVGMLIGDRVAAKRKRVAMLPSVSPTLTGFRVSGRF